jgi:hypothetical protein
VNPIQRARILLITDPTYGHVLLDRLGGLNVFKVDLKLVRPAANSGVPSLLVADVVNSYLMDAARRARGGRARADLAAAPQD